MLMIANEHVSITFADGQRVCLASIKDVVTGHEYMTTPQKLFEFAVDNGPVRESDADLLISQVAWQDPSRVRIIAKSTHTEEPLTFSITVAVNAGAPAVVVQLQVTSTDTVPVFLRMVLPKISGLLPPGGALRRRGMVPKEIGCVTDLIGLLGGEHQLGMRLNLKLGLPLGMNALEVASIFDCDGGGGIFFADFDSNLEKGVPPIQLTLSESEVAGFWTTYLEPNKPVLLPGLAIGVYHGGDWHHAIDAYVIANRDRWNFPEIPSWFRDQGAIYTFAGGGAGGIYLSLPGVPSLSSGGVHVAWESGDGRWRDQASDHGDPDGPILREGWPQAVTPAGWLRRADGVAEGGRSGRGRGQVSSCSCRKARNSSIAWSGSGPRSSTTAMSVPVQ